MNVLGTKSKRRWLYVSTLVIATGMVTYAIYNLLPWYQVTHKPISELSTKTVTHSTDTPDESNLDDACSRYEVAAEKPRKIRIESIGVDTCIQPVGIDQNKAVAVPSSIYLTGWYVDSVLPGQKGNSIIDGHVSGRYGKAVFADLKYLQVGNKITIQYGDLTEKTFKVVETKRYKVSKAGEELFRQRDDIERQLTLITCGGRFDNKLQAYDKRTIVRASINVQTREEN